MKYVYTGGQYAEFRGHVFWNNKPVDIRDKGTLAEIAKRQDFMPVEEAPEVEEVVIPPPENACPKCGKVLKKQGAHFHIRRCGVRP